MISGAGLVRALGAHACVADTARVSQDEPDVAAPARTWRAAVFALVAVTLPLVLRAQSDGSRPPVIAIFAAAVLVAIAVRPLTLREHRLPLVVFVLVGMQLLLHAGFLYASTGQLSHAGAAGLFCSPPAPDSGGVASCLPTHRGGALLFGVQILAALVFAAWLHSLDRLAWSVVRHAVLGLTAPLRCWTQRLAAAFQPGRPEKFCVSLATPESEPLPSLPVPTRAHGRRGPPAPSATRPSVGRFADHLLVAHPLVANWAQLFARSS